ncbi:MAG: hypothetical protein HY791_05050 [Deltaproteobacteria bacterium]|nr:hypothetical protein [Deltaproteobacteria bacterium]
MSPLRVIRARVGLPAAVAIVFCAAGAGGLAADLTKSPAPAPVQQSAAQTAPVHLASPLPRAIRPTEGLRLTPQPRVFRRSEDRISRELLRAKRLEKQVKKRDEPELRAILDELSRTRPEPSAKRVSALSARLGELERKVAKALR